MVISRIEVSLIFTLLLLANLVDAKTQKGYIVTLNNDTIVGGIIDKGKVSNAKHCNFINSRNKEKEKFSPSEILGYSVLNGCSYVSKERFAKKNIEPVFLEVLIDGPVRLYFDPFFEKKAFYIETEQNELVCLRVEVERLRPKELYSKITMVSDYYMQIDLFKVELCKIFSDCPDVIDLISHAQYTMNDIMYLVKVYTILNYGENYIKYIKKI